MKFKHKELEFVEIYNDLDFHKFLQKSFGFPNFYGNNINALIDCLSGLRYPDEGMISLNIDTDEILLLTIIKFDSLESNLMKMFIRVIGEVNKRQIKKGNNIAILLKIIGD